MSELKGSDLQGFLAAGGGAAICADTCDYRRFGTFGDEWLDES
jgi:hypothetical protein